MKNGRKALSTLLALLLIITLVVPAGASAQNLPPGVEKDSPSNSELTNVTLTPNNAMVGDTLTATVEPADPNATYAWYAIDDRNIEMPIQAAGSDKYTIPASYVGYMIRVEATSSTGTSPLSSPPTDVINARCTEGSGQGYNQQALLKDPLSFSFNGDYDRLSTTNPVTLTSNGSEMPVDPKYYKLAPNADNTTELLLGTEGLDKLPVGTYTIKLHYLGDSFGEVELNIVSQKPITSVTLNNMEPKVGDLLSFVTEPENTDLKYRWTYKMNGSDEEKDLGYDPTYVVEEDDIGYLIGVTAWVKGSTTDYVESERTNPVEAIVVGGNNAIYTPGDDALSFRFNGAMNLLDPQTPVTVTSASGEEQPLAENDYTITTGSTVVTLAPSYLDSLTPGNYILTVLYRGMSKASADFSVTAIRHTENLVALGDSITTGYGLDGYQSSPVPYAKDSFVSILSAQMAEAPTNLGVDGLTTEQLAAELTVTAMNPTSEHYLAIASGDIISLTIGGNDLLSKLFLEVGISFGLDPTSATFKDDVMKAAGTAIATQDPTGLAAINAAIIRVSNDMGTMVSKFTSELTDAIASIKMINPTATIVLQTIPNPYVGITGLSNVLDQGVSAFNTVINAGSSSNTYFVIDVYGAFKDSSEVLTNATNPKMFLDPHPNKAGHALIAGLLSPFLPIEPGSVSAHVAWENDTAQIRPASIDLQLYKNGNPWGDPVTVSEATNWDAFWPEVNRDAVWTVDETSVPANYTKTISADNLNFTITNTHEHVWDNGVITTPATIDKEGVKTFTCTICGVTRTEAIPKLPPVPVKPVSASVHIDWKNDTAKIRPASIDVQLYKNGSPWGNPVTVSEATNWDASWPELSKDATWTVDETSVPKSYTKTISADNLKFTITNTHEHVWNKGIITTPATVNKEGVKTFTCTICGATRTEAIPKLPPAPNNNNPSNTTPGKTTVTPAKQSTPKTGDTMPIMIFVLLTLGSLATVTTITVIKKKRGKIG